MFREDHYYESRTAKWVQIALVVIIAISFALRLTNESLWFDEGFTLSLMRLSPTEIIQAAAADTAPPLYYLLLKAWTNVFGTSEVGLRSLSCVLCILCVLLIWKIARRVTMHDWAVAAALVLAGCAYPIRYHAEETRFYGLIAFFALAAIDRLFAFLSKPGWGNALLVSLCVAGGLYTHNTFAFYTLGIVGAALFYPSRMKQGKRVLALFGIFAMAGLLFAPWVPNVLAQMKNIQGNFWMPRPDNSDVILTTLSRVFGVNSVGVARRFNLPMDRHLLIAAAVCALAGVMLLAIVVSSAITSDETRAQRVGAIVFIAIIPLLMITAYSLIRQPIFVDRAFIITSVLMPIILVVPISLTESRPAVAGYWVAIGLLLSLFVTSAWHMARNSSKESYRDATDYILQHAREKQGALFVSSLNQVLFDYYTTRSAFRENAKLLIPIALPRPFYSARPPRLELLDKIDPIGPLEKAVQSGQIASIVWLRIHYEQADPKRLLPEFLQRHGRLIDSKIFRWIVVETYEIVPEKK